MKATPILQAALNGSREHPNAPRTVETLARDARLAVGAGAREVHVHAFAEGRETLAPGPCATLLQVIRRECPGVPLSLTTSAAIEPDPANRLALVSAWTALPDLVSANQGEPGIHELCEHLMARGVGVEAGLLGLNDARAFAAWEGRHRCARVLIEPLDERAEDAVRSAAAMEAIVREAGVTLPQIHHGDRVASWAVNARALERGHGIRTGLEDTPVLPDGTPAPDNLALVRAAVAMMRETSGPSIPPA